MIGEIAAALGMDEEDVRPVLDEFMLRLHKCAHEYEGMNGDYVGEQLRFDIGPQAYYHLLGFLDLFANAYTWEPGTSGEYLLRLGRRSDWVPFRHQMEGWKVGRLVRVGREDIEGE